MSSASLSREFLFNGNQVRIFPDTEGEPWFVLADLCKVLNLTSPHKVADRVPEAQKGRSQVPTLGGTQNMTTVNEAGFYRVVLRSDSPQAEPMIQWVTEEVLPTIRKHGAYVAPQVLDNWLTDPDRMIEALTALKTEREKNQVLEEKTRQDAPKVLFADSVSASKTSILVGELAKILKGNGMDTGQNRLFQQLRDEGYLIRRQGTDYSMPSQKAMELGLFEVKETAVNHSDGHVTIQKTVKVTGKGQVYFVRRYLGTSLVESVEATS